MLHWQSDKFSVSGGGLKQGVTVEMFAPEQLPVKTKLIEEFGLVSLCLPDEQMSTFQHNHCSNTTSAAVQQVLHLDTD
jgi:hypothetical protein